MVILSGTSAASFTAWEAVGAVDGTARGALIVVVVLLLAIVGAVAALAMVMRRRTARQPAADADPAAGRAAVSARRSSLGLPAGPPVVPRVASASSSSSSPPSRPPRAVTGAGGGLAVASSGMVCPTCRTEYQGFTYCTRDARRLVPAEEMLANARPAGGVCVSCRRAYEPGLRRCPHDGGDLVPATVAAALRGRQRATTMPTGVLAKICPSCRQRFDLAARFCGHDGTEMLVVN